MVLPAAEVTANEPARVQAAIHTSTAAESAQSLSSETVPEWAADAVFYQIFPERFANGDLSNDPTRESLESPESVPESWTISPWTGDWYARSATAWCGISRSRFLRFRF